jgi:hypothetical protein
MIGYTAGMRVIIEWLNPSTAKNNQNMSKKQLPGNIYDEDKHVLLLRKQLEEASLKMELLRRDQVIKTAELARVSKELEELNKLYKGYKLRKRN